MHFNTGYRRDAHRMMRGFLRTFSDAETICIPSSSCVAMIRDQYRKLAGDETLREVEATLPRVFEFSELLIDRLGVEDVGAFYPHKVTYHPSCHPSCHSLRALRLSDKPLRLLRNVRGLKLADLPAAEECCGFGGTFAVKNPEVSAAMLSQKVHAVQSTEAEVCCGVDNSCLMQIFGSLSRQRTGVRTAHLAEILAETESGP
jgi:L-lactate dehydrogenase complex protein LldE